MTHEDGAGEILDGKRLADLVCENVRAGVEVLVKEHNVRPGLAVILAGDDPASKIYVERKRRVCERVGIISRVHKLSPDITEDELVHFIYRLNRDREIHGILVQLPLPDRVLEKPAMAEINCEKDVDGLSPISQARLLAAEPGLRPCTPLAVIELIDSTGIDLAGKRTVVVGMSALVGKPLSMMLLERNATVTMCHEFTRDLVAEVADAEVLIAAVGKPGVIRGEWVRKGAVVIDVGINRTRAGIVGDVEFASARRSAGFITPVPGGVGPMTIAMLVRNTLIAAQRIVMQPG